MEQNSVEQKYNKWIVLLSILIPVAVAILFNLFYNKEWNKINW